MVCTILNCDNKSFFTKKRLYRQSVFRPRLPVGSMNCRYVTSSHIYDRNFVINITLLKICIISRSFSFQPTCNLFKNTWFHKLHVSVLPEKVCKHAERNTRSELPKVDCEMGIFAILYLDYKK